MERDQSADFDIARIEFHGLSGQEVYGHRITAEGIHNENVELRLSVRFGFSLE